MNTSFHTCLPCRITSVAQPVKALRFAQIRPGGQPPGPPLRGSAPQTGTHGILVTFCATKVRHEERMVKESRCPKGETR
jgi:hypothetical protein